MATKRKKLDYKKLVCWSPVFRVSFPQVFDAKAVNGGKPKYSIQMIFDVKTDLKTPIAEGKLSMKQAVNNAILMEWPDKKTRPQLRLPFKDGKLKGKGRPEYDNTIVVSASSSEEHRPGVLDEKGNPIVKEDQSFYAGCYARAQLLAMPYSYMGEGVTFYLQNVKKVRDGEPLSGRQSAADAFEGIEEDRSEDDESSYDDNSDEGDSADMGF